MAHAMMSNVMRITLVCSYGSPLFSPAIMYIMCIGVGLPIVCRCSFLGKNIDEFWCDCRLGRERIVLLVLREESTITHNLCSGHIALPTSPNCAMSNRLDEAAADDGRSQRLTS